MRKKFIIEIGDNCVGCGVCSKICPKKAVKIEKGIKAVVDKEICIGCGLCVINCPAGIIKKVEQKNG